MRRREQRSGPRALPVVLCDALLADRPTGCYPEYTVVTPAEGDRGARRIVTGRDGERYWTADHYASFAEIIGDGTTNQGAG